MTHSLCFKKDVLFVLEPDFLLWEKAFHNSSSRPPPETPITKEFPIHSHQETNGWILLSPKSSSSSSTSPKEKQECEYVWLKPNWTIIFDLLSFCQYKQSKIHLAVYSQLSENFLHIAFEHLFHQGETKHLLSQFGPIEFLFLWGSSRHILCGETVDEFQYRPHPFVIFQKYPLWTPKSVFFLFPQICHLPHWIPSSLLNQIMLIDTQRSIAKQIICYQSYQDFKEIESNLNSIEKILLEFTK